MNREILFRGKRMTDGRWVYGDYHKYTCTTSGITPTPTHYIMGTNASSKAQIWVDPSTVGQYTDMTDKNGVKIFEGDIVSAKNNICGGTYRFLVEFGVCGGEKNVEYPVGFPCFFFKEVTGVIPSEYMMRKDPVYFLNAYICEVIGNAYDNPELLEGNAK